MKHFRSCQNGFLLHVYDNRFVVLPYWTITLQAHLYDIPPGNIILVPATTLYISSIRQDSFNYRFEILIFGLTGPWIKPKTSQIRSECFTTRLLVLDTFTHTAKECCMYFPFLNSTFSFYSDWFYGLNVLFDIYSIFYRRPPAFLFLTFLCMFLIENTLKFSV